MKVFDAAGQDAGLQIALHAGLCIANVSGSGTRRELVMLTLDSIKNLYCVTSERVVQFVLRGEGICHAE